MSLVYFSSGFITAVLMAILGLPYLYKRWKKEKSELIEKHNQFINVVENSNDFIYYYQVYPERQYKYLSPSAENIFGEGSIEYAYLNPDVCFTDVHPDDYEVLHKKIIGEIDYSKSIIQRWKDKDGKYRWFEEYATPIYENRKLVAIQGVLRTIDEKIELQEKLQYQLYHDILTGIYNRGHFELNFAKYNEEINVPMAIILCDLDELKYINDNFGHKEGDVLIRETAGLLDKFSSDFITVARIGGDEFVLIVAEKTKKEIEQLINDISIEINKHNTSVNNIMIKLSVGYAYTTNSIGQMTDLLTQADKNMYKNKIERKQLLSDIN
ncbi:MULTISPECIES: sensor domain-containing diguanylate cyclase [Bacillaceae]|uniref:sensor domain-containing diguanylate cyclase n=1 Tax=Bacillaceae TaxID=186817 RepID=UPI00155FD3D5|nr:sensor domain-containing diguanylate cyclase [Niallia circulans]NRG28113.1 GGDEF domain-containing protein [Niallia circulans]